MGKRKINIKIGKYMDGWRKRKRQTLKHKHVLYQWLTSIEYHRIMHNPSGICREGFRGAVELPFNVPLQRREVHRVHHNVLIGGELSGVHRLGERLHLWGRKEPTVRASTTKPTGGTHPPILNYLGLKPIFFSHVIRALSNKIKLNRITSNKSANHHDSLFLSLSLSTKPMTVHTRGPLKANSKSK